MHQEERDAHLPRARAVGPVIIAHMEAFGGRQPRRLQGRAEHPRMGLARAHAVTTRFRLEMRREYGEAKADALTREILDRLPAEATLEEAEKFAADYRKAHRVMEDHAEHPTIRDIIRGLFLLPEENTEDHYQRQSRAREKAKEPVRK